METPNNRDLEIHLLCNSTLGIWDPTEMAKERVMARLPTKAAWFASAPNIMVASFLAQKRKKMFLFWWVLDGCVKSQKDPIVKDSPTKKIWYIRSHWYLYVLDPTRKDTFTWLFGRDFTKDCLRRQQNPQEFDFNSTMNMKRHGLHPLFSCG